MLPTRLAPRPHLFAQDVLEKGVGVGSAIFLGPGHRQPSLGRKLLAEIAGERIGALIIGEDIGPPIGDFLVHEFAKLCSECLSFGGVFEIHGRFLSVRDTGVRELSPPPLR